MLLLSAHPLGLNTSVFAASADEPAAQVCGQTQLGKLDDANALAAYVRALDVVTFESEFVDTERLARVLPRSVYVFPSLEAIGTIQDRLTQKQLLDRFKIPTAPWCPVTTETELATAETQFKNGFVLKQRRFGYDGYGTFTYKKGRAEREVLTRTTHGFIAESFIPFKRELATSFVRSRSGRFQVLPLVESLQENSRCLTVHGPIRHSGLKALTARFKKLMNAIDYVGILAVELFDTGRELLVNELAPRVHNSAHYSIDALGCSQFEYHWRAGLDWDLPKVAPRAKGFAMINLLGEGGAEVHLSTRALGALHWYGKGENRAGRKLGHINVLAPTAAEALRQAWRWRKDFKL